MNDALPVNSYVDLLERDVKQPPRFDYLESFVDQGCRVDRNFLTHRPRRVRQSLLWCDVVEVIPFVIPECSA